MRLQKHEFKVGTVFKWNNFPDPKIGSEIKPRWFIYLGASSIFSNPIISYISTTTTKIKDFDQGGKRESHNKIDFLKGNFPFEEDCVLDLDEGYYPIENSKLEIVEEIEIKGELDKNIMKRIYNGILKSEKYSKRVLLDIQNSFNQAGIEGLKRPK